MGEGLGDDRDDRNHW